MNHETPAETSTACQTCHSKLCAGCAPTVTVTKTRHGGRIIRPVKAARPCDGYNDCICHSRWNAGIGGHCSACHPLHQFDGDVT